MAFVSLVAVAVLVFGLLYYKSRTDYRKRMPAGSKPLPGPKGLPWVGNAHEVPVEKIWLKFHDWSKVYGPIYQMEMFGSIHVWISSEEVATDILSRRAAINSDRPQIPNLPNNKTAGEYLALHGHNETWKRQRKLASHLMAQSAKASLHDYPTKERDRFLHLLAQDPSQYREIVEQFTARTVSRLSWGSAHPANVLRTTTFGLLETISPAGALPNVISFLRHVPYFMSPWKQKEYARHKLEKGLFQGNVRHVQQHMDEGTAEPSFIRTFLTDLASKAGHEAKWGDEKEAMYVVGQMAIAGALTIGSPIQSFILAMLHYPEWLAKLQQEIDDVCGGRCPEWADREKTPLLRAVVKEVIRWRPPVPTGIPHASEKDDVYNGYFIPAGATIHACEWSITRNEAVYPDADAFNPGRWVEPGFPTYREPLTQYPNLAGFSQFGFGRRTCQGVPIVEQDLYLAMGGIAWAFHLSKKRRDDGSEVAVHWMEYTPLLIAKPAAFEFDAVPRTPTIRSTLQGMWETGKGDDDDDDEDKADLLDHGAQAAEEEKMRVQGQSQARRESDTTSVGGSETSGASDDGSVTSSGSADLSARDLLHRLDIWA